MTIKSKVEKGEIFTRVTRSVSSTDTPEEKRQVFKEIAEGTDPRKIANRYADKAKEILKENGIHTDWPEVLLEKPSDQRLKDAIQVIIWSHILHEHIDNNNINDACYAAMMLEGEWTKLHIRPHEANTGLGRKRRQNLKEFGDKQGKYIKEERQKEWERWRKEAALLIEKNPALAGNRKKTELARKIKAKLELFDSTETIRKRI